MISKGQTTRERKPSPATIRIRRAFGSPNSDPSTTRSHEPNQSVRLIRSGDYLVSTVIASVTGAVTSRSTSSISEIAAVRFGSIFR